MSPKLVQDIQGYKWKNITAGGVTLFASTWDPKEGDFVVGWGQSATCGELALGEGSLKSATRPTRIESLDGVTLVDMSAGQNTTFFIARPPPSSVPAAAAVVANSSTSVSATDKAAASVSATVTAGVDMSGFGFDFAPVVVAKPLGPTISTHASEAKLMGPSRTLVSKWEAFPRFPSLDDDEEGGEECQICGKEEGDALECEKVCIASLLYQLAPLSVEGENWFE